MVNETLMSIDRVRKPGPAPPLAGREAGRTRRAFEPPPRPAVTPPPPPAVATPARPASPALVEATRESTPLERLRAHEISLDAYLELKVDEATAHLSGLPAEQLEQVRAALRAQLSESPELADLVRQATAPRR